MIPIETYEVWVVNDGDGMKVWGGDDHVVAIKAWENVIGQYDPNHWIISLNYNPPGI